MHARPRYLALLVPFLTLSPPPARAVDEPDELMPGRVTVIKPAKLMKFVAKAVPNTVFALPDPSNDPTAAGGSLHVFDAGTSGGDDTYVLPAGGWTGLGTPAGAKGFKYNGDGSLADPCKVVLVKPAVVKAVCKGSGVGLTPPFAGDVAVVLALGTATKRYCATFGGDEVSNVAEILKRKNASPAACPSTCGDGVTDGAEECDDGNTLPNDGCDPRCLPEETTSQAVSAGGTLTSDDEADGATAPDPLETAVTSPVAGTVTIFESSSGTVSTGYEIANQAADITAPPAASPTTPLTIQFTLDASQLRPGDSEHTVQVFRDGVLVPACVGSPTQAYPDPCVFERVLLAGNDVRLGVRAGHASKWTLGFGACGNGMLNPGEACDPPGVQAECAAGQVCKSDCTCSAACDCCAAAPTRLTFSHVPSAGVCGTAGATSLTCGALYVGGGNADVPEAPLAENTSVMAVTACDSISETLTLGPTTALDTGNATTCTAAGCLFGAPTPVPYPTASVYSACVVMTRPAAASGAASCDGVASIPMPLSAAIYLTGDSVTDPAHAIAGIQPCPLCSAGTCVGGPNHGAPCVAETSVLSAGHPTSSHCPPDPMFLLTTMPLGATLTTGTAVAKPSPSPLASYCGHCRDADGTGDFANPAFRCRSNADCAPVSPTYEACQQRTVGAFGSSPVQIDMTGTVSGCLADELPHPAGLAGIMCMEPLYFGPVDVVYDVPGPAAFSLKGTFQLQ